jgi:hypothetical protein
VSGAGGSGLYEVRESDPRLEFSNDRQYGALRLKLSDETADYAFVSRDGRVLDSGRIACRLQ